jgi:hypothetical protein
MFKRRATGRQILPSELGAPSMTRAPAPMRKSGLISADLAFLHHMSDDQREDYANGERPLRAQFFAPPGLSAMGYIFRRLSLRR